MFQVEFYMGEHQVNTKEFDTEGEAQAAGDKFMEQNATESDDANLQPYCNITEYSNEIPKEVGESFDVVVTDLDEDDDGLGEY